MKFRVNRTFLVRTEEIIELNPKKFKSCANIEELINDVEDYINDQTIHPTHPNFTYSEQIGLEYQDMYWNSDDKSFYGEWQKLKGIPQEIL